MERGTSTLYPSQAFQPSLVCLASRLQHLAESCASMVQAAWRRKREQTRNIRQVYDRALAVFRKQKDAASGQWYVAKPRQHVPTQHSYPRWRTWKTGTTLTHTPASLRGLSHGRWAPRTSSQAMRGKSWKMQTAAWCTSKKVRGGTPPTVKHRLPSSCNVPTRTE